MARRSLDAFLSRVWLTVTVVVVYLLVLQGLHVLDRLSAHRRLEAATEARGRAVADVVVQAAGRDRLLASLASWRERGTTPVRPSVPRPLLLAHGVTAVELLTPGGWGLGAAVGARQSAGEPAGPLDEAQLRRLSLGETVVDLEAGLRGSPVYAVATVHHPLLDSSARLAGVLRVDVSAEPLARSRRELRWGMAIEGGSLVVFCLLLLAFTRWIVRPMRLLAQTTREGAEGSTEELARRDETGFVIDTYRRMIEQLQDKEQELRRLREVERHRADELQELNASIVDSLVSGVLIVDLSGRVRSVNDVFREVVGIAPGRVLGRPIQDVMPHAPELQSRIQACLDAGTVIRRDELRLNLPGIGRRDVGLTLSPLKSPDGNRTGALCLLVDVTELKRLQERVRLKESLAELGELSAGIAHEFRNSLATILGFAKLVERQAEGDAVSHAAAIATEVGALRQVVDDFLRFANPTRLVVEPVDLDALMRDLAEDARSRAAGKPVKVEVPSGLPPLSGDETLLRRLLTNLVRNAVDAVGPGGRVRVSAEEGGGELTLHVDDDGPGIPAADRERIFTPFFTRKEHGTGLGLALARKVVVHHGGRIVADGSPLGGARLSVTLPLRPERTEAAP